MAKIFNDAARQRIISAVRKVERLQVAEESRTPRPPFRSQPTFFILKEDIEHGEIGNGILAGAQAFDSQGYSEVDGAEEVEIYNFGQKVWNGVTVLCDRVSLPTASAGSAMRWVIRQAWSATRIRGIADTQINPGSNGTLRSIESIDGEFPYQTAVVRLSTNHVTIKAGMVVWAELSHSYASTPNTFWHVYSADCDGA